MDDGDMSMRGLHSLEIDSPVGRLTLVANDAALLAVMFPRDTPERRRLAAARENPSHPILLAAAKQLGEYFSGTRQRFDLPLEFEGTDFQREVWAALLMIPYGETRSYSQIARGIGRPAAVRAVGAANGRNPIAIIAPCHRVIGSGGDLTGFGGGLPRKAWLLELEAPQASLVPRSALR